MWRPRRRAQSMRAAQLAHALSHAFGAVFDNPDLIVACVVGDGEAEKAPHLLAFEQVPHPWARCCRSCIWLQDRRNSTHLARIPRAAEPDDRLWLQAHRVEGP